MKHYIFVLLVLVAYLMSSCNKKNKAIVAPSSSYDTEQGEFVNPENQEAKAPTEKIPKEKIYVLASLQKMGCYGSCPEYEYILKSNGEAILYGKKNTARIGKFKTLIDAEQRFQLQLLIDGLDFNKLEKTYPTNGNIIKELPDTYILVNNGKEEKIIRNNHDAPKAILKLEELLEDFFQELNWEQVK